MKMVNQSLLNRLDALEASYAKDPELLAEKISLTIDQMLRTMPGCPDDPEEFEREKQAFIRGHHKRPKDEKD